MEKIFSSHGFVDDFIEGLNPLNSNPTIYAFNESLRKNKVTVSFPPALTHYLEVKRKNTTDLIQKTILDCFLNHLQTGRVHVEMVSRTLKVNLTVRKSILEDLNYSTGATLFVESRLTEKDPVNEIIKLLGCHLFTQVKNSPTALTGLFSSISLPTISQGTAFSWQTYLRDYVVYTKEITIMDSYLLDKWESFANLEHIVSLFSRLPFNHKISVRIITKDIQLPISAIQQKLSQWASEVKVYRKRSSAEFTFHDRWLITDQWIINSPAGFDMVKNNGKSKHETTPVLYGRYSHSDDIWVQNTGKLENLINDQCELVG